jgi:hypothetical protein
MEYKTGANEINYAIHGSFSGCETGGFLVTFYVSG